MIIIETKAAVRNRQSSRPYSVWSVPSPETGLLGYEATSPGNGGARAFNGRLQLRITPKFRLPDGCTFFTAGSCFAREIELALHLAGQAVRSWHPGLDLPGELFHRYNTFSIINDFEFAAGRAYDEANVVAAGDKGYTDFTGYGTWPTAEETIRNRRRVIDIHRNAQTADAVIITLGLVEAWFDRTTGTYLNTSPYNLFHRQADRFELRITDYAENRAAALRLLDYLRSVNPAVKVVLTVSPVPFSDTFSGQDVVVANTYSKAVLRSVAQDLAHELDFVDYFPSYEIVMLSDPSLAWLPDRRHVQREHVGHIVSEFMAAYLDVAGAVDVPASAVPAIPDHPEPAASVDGSALAVPLDPPQAAPLATVDRAANAPGNPADDIEAILASRLFDPHFYKQQLQGRGLEAGGDLIRHYVLEGEAGGLLPLRLFDPAYYRTDAGALCPAGSAMAHYVRDGWRLGLRTHPLFDSAYYNLQNPDVPEAGVNPLFHYLHYGGLEGRRPNPLFHSWLYVTAVPALRDTKEDPLSHYLRVGWTEGLNPHPLFDTGHYLSRYPDVAAAGVNPLLHFVVTGLAEGRNPNALFAPAAFRLSGADPYRLTEADMPAMEAACRGPRPPEEDHAALQAEIARRRGRTLAAGSAPGGPQDHAPAPRVIAFYLPQFHPIPENDRNWGEGFTEWRNVRQARPNFPGHDQPRRPGEFGYYDLRTPGVMERQAALAQQYGIHGFCFYWYWFNGKKPLAMPLERLRDTRSPDMPFCLCWANEPWTRKWAGGDEVIHDHAYSDDDDARHAAELARYLTDPRYIQVAGAPLLLIYRADVLPGLPGYLDRLRALLRGAGVERVHLAMVESGEFAWAGRDARPLGFDSSVEFPPHGGSGILPPLPDMLNPAFAGAIFDYRETVLRYATAPLPPYPRWRTVMAAWDNTARYQDTPAIFMNATPGGYRAWLESAVRDVQEGWPADERLVFVNAWNEWGEGTVLEPDARWGRAYLEATRDALADAGTALPGNARSIAGAA